MVTTADNIIKPFNAITGLVSSTVSYWKRNRSVNCQAFKDEKRMFSDFYPLASAWKTFSPRKCKCKLLARECSRKRKYMDYFRENRNLQMMFVTIFCETGMFGPFSRKLHFWIFINFWRNFAFSIKWKKGFSFNPMRLPTFRQRI